MIKFDAINKLVSSRHHLKKENKNDGLKHGLYWIWHLQVIDIVLFIMPIVVEARRCNCWHARPSKRTNERVCKWLVNHILIGRK